VPLSYAQYAGNGSATSFSVPFPYLLKAHVKLFYGYNLVSGSSDSELVDGVGFTWTSGTQVKTTVAPAVGQLLTVIRQTPTNALAVQWQDGSNLIAGDLQDSNLQTLYAVQEQEDVVGLSHAQSVAAVTSADAAVATADAAAATANGIAGTADTALSNSDAALATANAANATATSAQEAASGIAGTANTALSNSDAALTAANAAEATASGIAATANAAFTTANAAMPKAGGAFTSDVTFGTTTATILPVGSTAQRPAGASGMIRFNSTVSQFEGFNGTSWSSVGGGATGGGADRVFQENDNVVATNYTLSANRNAISAGPVTINNGVTVTIPSGSFWSIV
jgi:hypothetical protein